MYLTAWLDFLCHGKDQKKNGGWGTRDNQVMNGLTLRLLFFSLLSQPALCFSLPIPYTVIFTLFSSRQSPHLCLPSLTDPTKEIIPFDELFGIWHFYCHTLPISPSLCASKPNFPTPLPKRKERKKAHHTRFISSKMKSFPIMKSLEREKVYKDVKLIPKSKRLSLLVETRNPHLIFHPPPWHINSKTWKPLMPKHFLR